MAVQKLITRVLIPGGAAIAIPYSFSVSADEGCDDDQLPIFANEPADEPSEFSIGYETKPVSEMYLSPQDLPIYGGQGSEDTCNDCRDGATGEDPSQLQQIITKGRRSVMSSVDNLKIEENKDKLLQNIDFGITRIRSAYEHLSREENYLSRAAAISTGGLLGLLMARKGGIVKKVFYASIGMASAASVCYPKQAVIISDDLYKIGKYYALVAYQNVQEADKWRKKDPEKQKQMEWACTVGVPLKPPPIKVLLSDQCAGLKIFESDEEPAEKSDEDPNVERMKSPKDKQSRTKPSKLLNDDDDDDIMRYQEDEKSGIKQSKLLEDGDVGIKSLSGDNKKKIYPRDLLKEKDRKKPPKSPKKKELNFYDKVAKAKSAERVRPEKNVCPLKEDFTYKPCVRPSLVSIEKNFDDLAPIIRRRRKDGTVKVEWKRRRAEDGRKTDETNIMPKVSASDATTDILYNEAEASVIKLKARMKKAALTEVNLDEEIEKSERDRMNLPGFMESGAGGPKVWTESDTEAESNEQSGGEQKDTQFMGGDGGPEFDGDTVNIWTLGIAKKPSKAKVKEEVKKEKDEIDVLEQLMESAKKLEVSGEIRPANLQKPFHIAAEEQEKTDDPTSAKQSSGKSKSSETADTTVVKKEVKKKESAPSFFQVFRYTDPKKAKEKKSKLTVKPKSKVEEEDDDAKRPKPTESKSKLDIDDAKLSMSQEPQSKQDEVISSTLMELKSRLDDDVLPSSLMQSKPDFPTEIIAGAMLVNEVVLANQAVSAEAETTTTKVPDKTEKPTEKDNKVIKDLDSADEVPQPEEEVVFEEDFAAKAAKLAVDLGLLDLSRDRMIDAPFSKPRKNPGEIPRRVLVPKRLPKEFEPAHHEELSFLWGKPDDSPVREEENEEKEKFNRFIDAIKQNREGSEALGSDKRMWIEPAKDEVFESEPDKRDKFLTEIFTMGYSPLDPAPPDPDFPHVFTGLKSSSAKETIPPRQVQAQAQEITQTETETESETDKYVEYDYYDEYDGDLDDYDYIVVTDSRGEVFKPIPKKSDNDRKIPLAAL